jgi:hypothetical protein
LVLLSRLCLVLLQGSPAGDGERISLAQQIATELLQCLRFRLLEDRCDSPKMRRLGLNVTKEGGGERCRNASYRLVSKALCPVGTLFLRECTEKLSEACLELVVYGGTSAVTSRLAVPPIVTDSRMSGSVGGTKK